MVCGAAPGWDTIDEVKANMLGWETMAFQDLHLHHHRLTGTADGPDTRPHQTWCRLLRLRISSLFVGARCVYRLFKNRTLLVPSAIWYGFLKGYLTDVPRVNDARMIDYSERPAVAAPLRLTDDLEVIQRHLSQVGYSTCVESAESSTSTQRYV